MPTQIIQRCLRATIKNSIWKHSMMSLIWPKCYEILPELFGEKCCNMAQEVLDWICIWIDQTGSLHIKLWTGSWEALSNNRVLVSAASAVSFWQVNFAHFAPWSPQSLSASTTVKTAWILSYLWWPFIFIWSHIPQHRSQRYSVKNIRTFWYPKV